MMANQHFWQRLPEEAKMVLVVLALLLSTILIELTRGYAGDKAANAIALLAVVFAAIIALTWHRTRKANINDN